MKDWRLFILASILGPVLIFGCVRHQAHPLWLSNMLALKEPIGADEIFILPHAERIPFDRLILDLDAARVIFMGESHDQVEHHRDQLRVLQALHARGKEVVVGMEMFLRSQQAVLDRWSRGDLTEKEFRKEVNWGATWGTDYRLYKGILDEVKDAHLKLLGLNIDRDFVSKVAEQGVHGLSPQDRRRLPEMDLSDKDHRAYIRSLYTLHEGGQAKDFERFYESQCLWDEAMAETLSDFLKSPEGEGKTVLVFAGKGHIVYGFGIPKRFYRRAPLPFKTIVLKEWDGEMNHDLLLSSIPTPPGDFLWFTRPNPPGHQRPMIGITLQAQEGTGGLTIERVLPGSPAEKAGLLPGDRLVSIEGTEISDVGDIHDILSQKGWGKDVLLTIIRDGVKREIIVTLPAPN